MTRLFGYLAALAALSACSSGNPPTVSRDDVDRAFAEANRIERLPITQPGDIPSGTLTYDGQIGANIDGDIDGSILGDMTMVVGFSNNTIGGNVTNINLIDPDGRPDERLSGTLEINGTEFGGNLEARARGDVRGVEDGFVFDTEIDMDLNGQVRDDLINGDAVAGTAIGDARGDVDFDIEGVFFGTERRR